MLHRDLAYQQMVMPLDEARHRARGFVVRVDSREMAMLPVEDED